MITLPIWGLLIALAGAAIAGAWTMALIQANRLVVRILDQELRQGEVPPTD